MAQWFVVRPALSERGLELNVRDDEGRSFPPAERITIRTPLWRQLPGGSRDVWVPADWQPESKPLFLIPPSGHPHFDWETLVRQAIEQRRDEPFCVARYVPALAGLRHGFQLPLTILTLGEGGEYLRNFRRHGWIGKAEEQGALEISRTSQDSLLDDLQRRRADVMICEAPQVNDVMSCVREVHPDQRPGLVLASPAAVIHGELKPSVVPGTALFQFAQAPAARIANWTDNWLMDIIHGKRLDQIAASPGMQGRLNCGPDSIHGLSLPGVREQLNSRAREVEALARGLGVTGKRKISLSPILDAARGARNVYLNFEQEAQSLVPAGMAKKQLDAAEENLAAGTPLQISEKAEARLKDKQERRVDIALRRIGADRRPGEFIPAGNKLPGGGDYLLCVRIGMPFEKTLLTNPPPPIDPILPKQRGGHTLHVVVFAKNFTVKGSPVKRCALPAFGPSSTVEFRLGLPKSWEKLEARIGIYHKNNLLQNFLLTIDDSGARAGLTFSQTARFRNMDVLGERALSIAANHDQDGSARTLMIFEDGQPHRVSFTEQEIQRANNAFRDLLKKATVGPDDQPRFDTYPDPKAPLPDAFHEFVRGAANLGRELYLGLRKNARKSFDQKLVSLRGRSDQTLQFVRLHRNYVFPWQLIYDWKLPKDKLAKACPGFNGGSPCGHERDCGVYCVNGFWGVRHIVEELIASGGEWEEALEDVVVEQQVASRPGVVLLSADELEQDDDLATLCAALGDNVARLGPQEDLLEAIWKADKPALTILHGHMVTGPVDGKEAGPRLKLPGGRVLFAREVDERADDAFLENPRPVVLLLGCETGLVDLGMFNDFVSSFQFARAAAIVGTEIVAFRSLLKRFGKEIATDLWDQKELGQAITGFRRKLLAAGNPAPFVFHAVGSAKFHLKIEGKS